MHVLTILRYLKISSYFCLFVCRCKNVLIWLLRGVTSKKEKSWKWAKCENYSEDFESKTNSKQCFQFLSVLQHCILRIFFRKKRTWLKLITLFMKCDFLSAVRWPTNILRQNLDAIKCQAELLENRLTVKTSGKKRLKIHVDRSIPLMTQAIKKIMI